jgi:hypothetical protein
MPKSPFHVLTPPISKDEIDSDTLYCRINTRMAYYKSSPKSELLSAILLTIRSSQAANRYPAFATCILMTGAAASKYSLPSS